MTNNALSYIRVLAMLMIVMLHSLNYYGGWGFTECPVLLYQKVSMILNNIALPVFFFVSGYLFYANLDKYKSIGGGNFLKKKAKRLIIPYLFWAAIQMIIIPERYNLSQVPFGVSHLWFLMALFEIFFISILLKDIWEKMSLKQGALLIIILLFAFYPVSVITRNFLRLTSVVGYMPFFICGIMLNQKNNFITKISTFKILLIAIVSLLGIIFSHLLIENSMKHLIAKLSALIFVSYGVGFLLRLKLPLIPAVKFLDKNSMGIYILHHILIMFYLQFENVRIFLNGHVEIGPLLIFSLAFSISLVISCLLHSNKFTRVLIG